MITSRDAWAEEAGFSDAYPMSGYTRMPGGADESVRPLLAGTLLYIPGPSVAGQATSGRLWRVAQMFDPLTFTERLGDEDGEFVVQVQPLLRFDSAAVRRRHTGDVYDFAHATRAVAYDPGDFWVVDHLVHRVDPSSFTARKPNDTDERYRRRLMALTFSRFTFDWRMAQAAIDAVLQSDRDDESWVLLPPGGAAADVSVKHGTPQLPDQLAQIPGAGPK